MTRVLIAGGRGGLGRAIEERLTRPDTTLAPRYPGPVEVVSHGRDTLDISRREVVDRVVGEVKPDVVFNAAGFTHIDLAESHQWEAFLVNRDGAEHVARAASKVHALSVYVSTDLIFDGSKKTPYTEEDPPNPLSVYGDTKLAGELVVMSHAPRHLIVRTGWLFGHSGKHFLRAIQDGLAPNELLFGYEDQAGQPTLVTDFVDALIHLVANDHTGTFNAANAGQTTQFDALRRSLTLSSKRDIEVRPIRHSVGGRQAMRPTFAVLDCAKIASAGFTFRPWDEALASFLQKLVPLETKPHGGATTRIPNP
jgi:dTDP-4-dehydrorhamnose reductase